MSYKPHSVCRACGNPSLIPVFDFGKPMPLANDFTKPGEVRQGYYPVEVLFCDKCSLSQLSAVVDPEILYRNYAYTTGNSDTIRRHFERLFKDLESEVPHGGTLCEIGSNTGLLLAFAKNRGYRVCGIDPAQNLAAVAEQSDLHTVIDFFGPVAAEVAKDRIGHPAIILARHSLAHCDDWREWFSALEILAGKDTIIAIEVPWVNDTLRRAELDQLYSEHLSYISLHSILYLLRGTPFQIHRVSHYSIHGGALLIMLRHKDSKIEPHLSADEYLAEDAVTVEHWRKFSDEAHTNIDKLRKLVREHVSAGKRVCGFGASAKGTVWTHACGFNEKDLLFVSDNSPFKPGCLVPGTKIPVIEQDEFLSEHPDIAVCWAWNFKTEIMEKQKKWRDRGGKFIFPCQ